MVQLKKKQAQLEPEQKEFMSFKQHFKKNLRVPGGVAVAVILLVVAMSLALLFTEVLMLTAAAALISGVTGLCTTCALGFAVSGAASDAKVEKLRALPKEERRVLRQNERRIPLVVEDVTIGLKTRNLALPSTRILKSVLREELEAYFTTDHIAVPTRFASELLGQWRVKEYELAGRDLRDKDTIRSVIRQTIIDAKENVELLKSFKNAFLNASYYQADRVQESSKKTERDQPKKSVRFELSKSSSRSEQISQERSSSNSVESIQV